MDNPFFDHPILNSPYTCPQRHSELDADGYGLADPLHPAVEVKVYRGEDAMEKRSTMDTYWMPGVNHLGNYGRRAFAEFTRVFRIQADFEATIDANFNRLIEGLNS